MGKSISNNALRRLRRQEEDRIESMNRRKNYWGNVDLTPYNVGRENLVLNCSALPDLKIPDSEVIKIPLNNSMNSNFNQENSLPVLPCGKCGTCAEICPNIGKQKIEKCYDMHKYKKFRPKIERYGKLRPRTKYRPKTVSGVTA